MEKRADRGPAMKDGEIDDILKQAAQTPSEVDPNLLNQVTGSIGSSLRSVRPMPPDWVLAGELILACLGVAVAGAARAGFFGVRRMSGLDRGLIFAALGLFVWLAASASVREIIPGSRRRVSPKRLLAAGCVLLLAVFAILFHDYATVDFVHAGIACLATGLLIATPTGLLSWLILRRGLALNPAAAGLAAGTLAGLAGVTMLELHCPNFEALHILLWHTAVIPISAAAVAVLAWKLTVPGGSGSREGVAPR
jgi:hypothetical protein